MEFFVNNSGEPTAKTTGVLTQELSFDKTNSNGKAYSIFSAKTVDGATVSGIIYKNLADKIDAGNGSTIELHASVHDIQQGVNNHWSPAFTSVSAVSDADKASAQAFLDSL